MELLGYPHPWVRVRLGPGEFRNSKFFEHIPGRWYLICGELGPNGEKLTKIVWEQAKGEPVLVLGHETKFAFKDLELIFDGTIEQLAYVPESSSLALDNADLKRPNSPVESLGSQGT